jgi:hypothetical protein
MRSDKDFFGIHVETEEITLYVFAVNYNRVSMLVDPFRQREYEPVKRRF